MRCDADGGDVDGGSGGKIVEMVVVMLTAEIVER